MQEFKAEVPFEESGKVTACEIESLPGTRKYVTTNAHAEKHWI